MLDVMNPSNPDDVQRLVDLCAPPKAEASDWLRGSVHAERSRRERFLRPIQAQVDAVIASATHTVSPIVETIGD
uniref:hypothetical protein n=1 Tax=Streptococcus pneumoniae TaxID=1313 RepID=UPI0013DC0449